MRKIVLSAFVAVIAFSVASSALAGNGQGRDRGEGRFRHWFGWEKNWGHGKDKEGGDRGNKLGWFGECGKDARDAKHAAMKDAFSAFMTAKKAATDVRTKAIESADGDQTKITKAWEAYQTAFVKAWSDYTKAVTDAMKDFGTAFAKCDVVLKSPTPTP